MNPRRMHQLLDDPASARSPKELVDAYDQATTLTTRLQDAVRIVGPLAQELGRAGSPLREELEGLVSQLHRSFDTLRREIARIERLMAEQFQGRAGCVELPNGPEGGRSLRGAADRRPTHCVLFWQVRGVWGLYVLDSEGTIAPLTSSNHRVRTAAASVLPDLWDSMLYEDEVS